MNPLVLQGITKICGYTSLTNSSESAVKEGRLGKIETGDAGNGLSPSLLRCFVILVATCLGDNALGIKPQIKI